MRLAIPLDGGPSSVVTTPTTSRSPCGVMWTMLSTAGSTWLIDVSAESETILPNTSSPVATTNPIGWIGAVVPGGSTGRWTPFWPPLSRNVRTLAKFPNSALYTADLAPVGSGLPTWAITRPMRPGGTCTQSNACTLYIGHGLNRSPGISSAAW